MEKRSIGKTGVEASVLGLGCMRFPVVNGDNNVIDEEKAIEMIRYAVDHGINYVDTAFPYHGGNSEALVGKALKDGYRERIHLVTKSPSWLHETEADLDKYLDMQLERLGVECIDIYLLHTLNQKYWDNYLKLNVFDFINRAKASGKIKHIGFSFHDDYPVFEKIIEAYPWDLCMLQLNYMDMAEQAGLKGLKHAESLGIPVIVMEPLKGGMLATPSEEIAAIWNKSTLKMSPVEWALSYVANFENVKVILSGMSTLEQLKENIEMGSRLKINRLDEEALAIVKEVENTYKSRVKVPCTQCEYCMPCPQGVQIPRVFTLYNKAHIFSAMDAVKAQYHQFLKPEMQASNCIACGACEPKCPQKIQIIDALKHIASEM